MKARNICFPYHIGGNLVMKACANYVIRNFQVGELRSSLHDGVAHIHMSPALLAAQERILKDDVVERYWLANCLVRSKPLGEPMRSAGKDHKRYWYGASPFVICVRLTELETSSDFSGLSAKVQTSDLLLYMKLRLTRQELEGKI